MDAVRQHNQKIPSHVFWGCCGSNALLDWPTIVIINFPVVLILAFANYYLVVALLS
jgi:hypothetical protein